jgi:hypothetical protein
LKSHDQERKWNKKDCQPDIGELKLYYGGKLDGILGEERVIESP